MNFFEISIATINLFSIMMGVTLVVLSNYWGGRIFCTRIAFVYIALLALYYGFVKHNIIDFDSHSNRTATTTSAPRNVIQKNR